LQQQQPQLYDSLTKILTQEEQTIVQGVVHQADANTNAMAAAAAQTQAQGQGQGQGQEQGQPQGQVPRQVQTNGAPPM
ncbi:hypothetical protein MMC09_000232, partial [Bachmanniomyces sp. S44760]|nr:hypothetical protein [Bachmanniomyces sp. S44760]